MMEQLPAEVLHHILECITQDESTRVLSKLPDLRAFILTCKTFYLLGHPYLYDTVYLGDIEQSQHYLTALKERQWLGQHTRNIFLGENIVAPSPDQVVSWVDKSFPKAEEVAWVDIDDEGLSFGHRYSVSKSPVKEVHFIKAYHVLVPSIRWNYLSLLSSSFLGQLTHMTITVRKSFLSRSEIPFDVNGTEATLHLLLATCTSLQSLVISIGHDAAGLGSRVERVLRSLDIRDAVRRVDSARIRLEIAQHMFGAGDRTPAQDVITWLEESWLDSIQRNAKGISD